MREEEGKKGEVVGKEGRGAVEERWRERTERCEAEVERKLSVCERLDE